MKGLFFEVGFNDIIVCSFIGGVVVMYFGYKENSFSKGD